ncbi:MAG: hypothetical protein AAFY11_14910 [Cyanobacteria bacterium J06641_5]
MSIPVCRLLVLPCLSMFGATALLGCNPALLLSRFQAPAMVSIASLQEPQSLGRYVRLKGRVAEVVPLARSRVYRLEDDSGEVWVLDSEAGQSPAIGTSLSLDVRVAAEQVLTGDGPTTKIYVRRQQQL